MVPFARMSAVPYALAFLKVPKKDGVEKNLITFNK